MKDLSPDRTGQTGVAPGNLGPRFTVWLLPRGSHSSIQRGARLRLPGADNGDGNSFKIADIARD